MLYRSSFTHIFLLILLFVLILSLPLFSETVSVNAASTPVNSSLSPNTGRFITETKTTFTTVYSDNNGCANIAGSYLLINTALDLVNGVCILYDANTNKLWLRNDDSTAWLGGYAPGSGKVIQNSQCRLYCSETSVVLSGNTLTLRWRIEFKPEWAGRTCKAWMRVTDDTFLKTGWDQKGSGITISDGPSNSSLYPNNGTFLTGSQTTFTTVYFDGDGHTNLNLCYLLLNSTLSLPGGACLRYDSNTNLLYLRNDANTFWSKSCRPGSASVLENSQVRLYCKDTWVTGYGPLLTIRWALEIKPKMAGETLGAWMRVTDNSGLMSDWDKVGTLNISGLIAGMEAKPEVAGFKPGEKVTITTAYSDPGGYSRFAACNLLINNVLSSIKAVSFYYDSNTNKLYLRNDSNTGWLGGYKPGSSVILENSQCKLYCAETTVTGLNQTLTVNWRIEFKDSMQGKDCGVWMHAFNDSKVGSGWIRTGRVVVLNYKLFGIDFGPYVDGQSPDWRTPISEAQIRERLAQIAPYTNWIRTFGCIDGLENIPRIAKSMGLKVAVGIWLSKDAAMNEIQIQNAIRIAQEGYADIVVVGSETLLRRDLTEQHLIGYITRVKQAVPAEVLVTTGDTYGEYIAHPALISAVDIIFANMYPYWEHNNVENAVSVLDGWYRRLVAISDGKPVCISETGWPDGGDVLGDAVPSPQNAAFYFKSFISWARSKDVPYMYFESHDETYKGINEAAGPYWGVWGKNGVLKPGRKEVFDGLTTEDNWSGTSIPGGPGTPEIQFTTVPAYGSHENLKGYVWHVKPLDHRLAVYIYVSGWWNKPSWDWPFTYIYSDGSFACDITTGGVDSTATKIAAFLVPATYFPPLMSGGGTLPNELLQNSLAHVEVTRSP